MTSADVAENLMPQSVEEEVGTCLERLIEALQTAKLEAKKKAEEEAMKKAEEEEANKKVDEEESMKKKAKEEVKEIDAEMERCWRKRRKIIKVGPTSSFIKQTLKALTEVVI